MYICQSQRYIIDNDNDIGLSLAFPSNLCFQHQTANLSTSTEAKFVKYSCNANGTAVIKREYEDDTCNTPLFTENQIWKSNASSPCNIPKFSCRGEDIYHHTHFYLSSCAQSHIVLPIVPGCFCDSDTTSYELTHIFM